MRGDHNQGEIQTIFEELNAAFKIFEHLENPDGIGAVGTLLAQILAMGSHIEEALIVLDKAERAFERMGQQAGTDHCRALRAKISGETTS